MIVRNTDGCVAILKEDEAGVASDRASGTLARDQLASLAVDLRLRLWPTIPIPHAKSADHSPRKRRASARVQYAPSRRY